MRFYHIAIVGMLLFVTVASKAQSFGVGNIVGNGTGCPSGSITSSTDTEGNLVIHTDQFVAQVHKRGAKVDLKSCNLAIPLQIPKGLQLVVDRSEVGAYTKLTRKARAIIKSETFIAGSRGPVATKKLTGPVEAEVVLDSNSSRLVSKCGESLILRVSVSAAVEAKSKTAVGLVAVSEIRPLSRVGFQSCD